MGSIFISATAGSATRGVASRVGGGSRTRPAAEAERAGPCARDRHMRVPWSARRDQTCSGMLATLPSALGANPFADVEFFVNPVYAAQVASSVASCTLQLPLMMAVPRAAARSRRLRRHPHRRWRARRHFDYSWPWCRCWRGQQQSTTRASARSCCPWDRSAAAGPGCQEAPVCVDEIDGAGDHGGTTEGRWAARGADHVCVCVGVCALRSPRRAA